MAANQELNEEQIMNKQDMVYTHNGILLCLKNNWDLDICYHWMKFKDNMLNEIGQSPKDKYCKLPPV